MSTKKIEGLLAQRKTLLRELSTLSHLIHGSSFSDIRLVHVRIALATLANATAHDITWSLMKMDARGKSIYPLDKSLMSSMALSNITG